MYKKLTMISSQIRSLPSDMAAVARQALFFVFAFCLSFARLFGGTSPFAAALAACAPKYGLLAVYTGACCGFILQLNGVYTARLIAVVTASAIINWLLSSSKYVMRSAAIAPLTGGVCSTLGGLTVLFAQGFDATGMIIYICEGIICAGSAYFFGSLLSCIKTLPHREPLSPTQLSSLLASVCILLLSLDRLRLGGISFSHIAAVMAILFVSRWAGSAGGSISGGTMGFALGLGSDLPFLGSAYTFGGLLSGLLSPLGSAAQAGGFAVVNAVAAMMNSGSYDVLPVMYETAIATVAFVMMPKKAFTAGAVYFTGKQTMPEFETMKKALLSRLTGVKSGLEEVSQAMEQITGSIEKIDGDAGSEVKQLVRDQFTTLAMAVDDVTEQFGSETRFDTQAAAKVTNVLTGFGIEPKEVVFSRTDDIARLEINAKKIHGTVSRAALVGGLESACGIRLNSPTIRENSETTQLIFMQRPEMNLRIGNAQHTANSSGMCGDSCDSFLDKDGRQIIVLSDGMGTGPRAAVDGAVASWLFSKLLLAGLNFDTALRLSNSTLIVKSQEETLSTIDAVRIDLHTGCAEFFKAGAGISLMCRGKKLYSFGEPSMPLGILREVDFYKTQTTLKKGDILLMMSDGVSTEAYKAVAQIMRNYDKKDPTVLAQAVVDAAKQQNSQTHIDDITVVAVIVG